MQTGEPLSNRNLGRWSSYLFAAILAVASVAISLYIPALHSIPFACSFLAIAASAHLWRTGPALLSALLSLVGVNYFIIGTAFHFELGGRGLAQTAFLGLACAILISLVQQRDVARAARQRSEASLELTMSSIADGVIVTDTKAIVTFINPAAREITGWPAEEAIGTSLHQVLVLLNENTRKPVENPVDRVLATGSIMGLANHTVLIQRDGSEVPIDDSAAPARDIDGEVVGAVIVFRNISEQRRLERERDASFARAQRSADFMSLSAQGALVAAWDYNIQTEHANWAEGSYPVWGVPFEEVMTLDGMLRRISPDYHQAIRDAIARSMETGTYYTVEFSLISELGAEPRWCEARGIPIYDDEDKVTGLRGITIDITNRKRSEKALLRTERLAAAGRLAASVAHEINNPLESAINLVYIARLAVGSPEVVSYLEHAEQQLMLISHIARQSLAFYRYPLQPTFYRPAGAVHEVISVLQVRRSADHVQIENDLDEDLEVFGWAGDLRQIVSNLLANAIDAVLDSSSTASQRVTVRLRQLATPQVSRCPGLVLTVADTGKGIPSENKANIFEAFFTTKPETGTGLGLWVSRSLVDRSGGSIQVRSSTNRSHPGTVFRVKLPSQPRPDPSVG